MIKANVGNIQLKGSRFTIKTELCFLLRAIRDHEEEYGKDIDKFINDCVEYSKLPPNEIENKLLGEYDGNPLFKALTELLLKLKEGDE